MSEVMYLYAVADSDLVDADVTDMRAVDGAPVRIIAEAPIAAVVSAVDAERFSASALRRHARQDRYVHQCFQSASRDVLPASPARRPATSRRWGRDQEAVPSVLRGMKRTVLLVVSICVAMIAALAAIFILPAADSTHQIAEQTANTAGIPVGVAPGPPQ